MSAPLAPYTYISELGVLRTEVVASTIDALRVETHAGQPNGGKSVTKVLRVPTELGKQKLATNSLVDVCDGNPCQIPSGSTIECVKVSKVSASPLDENLSFVLGYLTSEVNSIQAKKALAGRIAPIDKPITGQLLNKKKHHSIGYTQKLTAEHLAAQQKLYADDAASANEEVEPQVSYKSIEGNTFVGESKTLYPAITLVSGQLNSNDIIFTFTYCPPAVQN